MLGPVFQREALVAPKRPRLYLARSLYLLAMFLLLCTGYLVLSGMRPLRSAGDLARFGGSMFLLLAPLQMLILTFQAAVGATSSVAQEKDRRTFILMLLTRLTGSEVVVGKLAASLIVVVSMLAATLPLFLALTLFGGVAAGQVGAVYAVTLATVLWAASVGTVVALWREKTFQSIAVTVLVLILWAGLTQSVAAGLGPASWAPWARCFSPIAALGAAVSPFPAATALALSPAISYTLATCLAAAAVTGWGILKVRVWNPSREVRIKPPEPETSLEAEALPHEDAESSAAATGSWKVRAPRQVWRNPILWREMRTWAYGRKVLLIRLGYLAICLLIGAVLYTSIASGVAFERTGTAGRTLPAATLPVAAIGVVSLLLVNALAVNSITTERDTLALDLLLVTDIRPPEFVFGKILGVLYVTKEMVLIPVAMLVALGILGVMTLENTVWAILGLMTLYLFVTTVGVHCGLHYPAGRTATLVSLGTIFFLCIGVAICMVIMVSFRGAFQLQLAPFLAMILGGGAGLYAALGWRNPSTAIFMAAFALPLITFYAITQFLLQRDQLLVFLPVLCGYGFATAAMLVPALSELDVNFHQGCGGETTE